jgi:GNAT superfamily N-acetyltransferase
VLLVRAATPSDAEAMEQVFVLAGRAAWGHILGPEALAALAPPAHWDQAIEDAAQLVLVAERDGEVVGFVIARPAADAQVVAFYTHPLVWGHGVGRELMGKLLAELARLSAASAWLWTAEENHRPRRFYEAAGWRLDGAAQRRSYKGSPEFVELRYRIELTNRGEA